MQKSALEEEMDEITHECADIDMHLTLVHNKVESRFKKFIAVNELSKQK